MNFIKNLQRNIGKTSNPHDNIKNIINISNKNLFRELNYKEKQAVEVYDYRDIVEENPNNNVLLTCEHASNFTHSYEIPTQLKPYFNTHWGYDIGAKDFGLELSEKSKILSIYSNYSRLILDPNRSLLSDSLIRKYVEKNVKLDFNDDGIYLIY
jgi:hypothetical protein